VPGPTDRIEQLGRVVPAELHGFIFSQLKAARRAVKIRQVGDAKAILLHLFSPQRPHNQASIHGGVPTNSARGRDFPVVHAIHSRKITDFHRKSGNWLPMS
jgi:hypothetical protein